MRLTVTTIAISTLLLAAMPVNGADEPQKTEETKEAERTLTKEEIEKMSPAEREALREQAIAARVSEYNEQVDNDLDKVVCKNQKVTGSRQKQRICRTVREWEDEKEATQRMLRKRGRASSTPAEGGGLGDPR